ncbi:MAG: GNAT family N-acetyltransferase [Oscillospiraceae bacterium]
MNTQDGNTPTLQTERLILRRFTQADLNSLFLIFGDKEVNTFMDMLPLKDLEEAKEYLQTQYLDNYKNAVGYHYAICLKSDNEVIGYVEVSDDECHNIDYGLVKKWWHKEIAPEAVAAVIKQLKKDGLPYVTAIHDVKNQRSGQVMKKVGMKYQYTYGEQWQPKNIPVTFRLYQLNLDSEKNRVFMEYWNKATERYVEKSL